MRNFLKNVVAIWNAPTQVALLTERLLAEENTRRELNVQVEELESDLEDAKGEVDDLERRLDDAEATIRDYEERDLVDQDDLSEYSTTEEVEQLIEEAQEGPDTAAEALADRVHFLEQMTNAELNGGRDGCTEG